MCFLRIDSRASIFVVYVNVTSFTTEDASVKASGSVKMMAKSSLLQEESCTSHLSFVDDNVCLECLGNGRRSR
jgi:hypothetical protein